MCNTVEDELLEFAPEEESSPEPNATWKILIVDDEPDVHAVTRLALDGFVFQGKGLTFLSAYTSWDARAVLEHHPDTALILLDVVMETDDAGLKFVAFVRHEMKNPFTRIILRTGQPGMAPESSVVLEYDINDYKTKSELTAQKLYTAVVAALRSYDTLIKLELHRQRLQDSVNASARFVPLEYLSFLGKKRIYEVELGDHVSKEMPVMFSGIHDFTALTAGLSAQESFDFLNTYLQDVSPSVRQHNGFVVKYVANRMMCAFPDGADAAVRASLGMLSHIDKINQLREQQGVGHIHVGLGLHTGDMMVGMIGEPNRMQGDAFSDTVNVTARLQKLTAVYQLPLIISQDLYNQLKVKSAYTMRYLGRVLLRGRHDALKIYELFQNEPSKYQTKHLFERGVRSYYRREFEITLSCMTQVLEQRPQDYLARLYWQRAQLYLRQPPAQDWTGVLES